MRYSPCFNEAAVYQLRKSTELKSNSEKAKVSASMRPQSINCGNHPGELDKERRRSNLRDASMRPQSINCGNRVNFFGTGLVSRLSLASMRPQSINCGNPIGSPGWTRIAGVHAQLQ